MNKFVKYLLFALALGLFICMTALVRMQVRTHRHLTTCKNVEIIFKDTLNFVSEDDVRSYLRKDCPNFIGQRIDSLRLHEIEKVLDSRSAILSAQAWTADSTLFISIVQREPVARMESSAWAFYIDDRGYIFPVQGDCGKRFPLIKGEIPLNEAPGYKGLSSTEEGRAWTAKILDLLSYMRKNRWDGRIDCISVGSGGRLTMVPAEGNERFIFGRPENASEKFGKINEYYKRIKPVTEDRHYKSVDVQYKGQIICRK
jgi:cell division protein FtsQ